MSRTALFSAALAVCLIYMAPALAHLLELPHKMALDRAQYFTVQQIYVGWELFAVPILIQLFALALLTWRSAGEYYVFRPVLAALAVMLAAQALFWLFTFPANAATANWTQAPPDWDDLREQWEWSHAAGALCQLLALCSLLTALFARVRAAGR